MVLETQSTTKDYIRAEGDFHKEKYSSKDQSGRPRPEEQSGIAESFQENLWNEIQLKVL